MRDGLNFMLSQSGYPFCAVANGAQGLERFAQGGIDLMLLDLSLPDMPGDRLLTRLKTHATAIPVIISTGFAPPILCSQRLIKSSLNPSA